MNKTSKLFALAIGSYATYNFYNQGNQQPQKIYCKDKSNYFIHSLNMIPHPEKAYKGGEDAAYVDSQIIAVADGVGGWASHGVDPKIYSNRLIDAVRKFWHEKTEQYRKNPKELLEAAASVVDELGSSTLVICTLDDRKHLLYTTYMGDSGYLIFRPNKEGNDIDLFYEFQEMQKAFNFPYQLGYQKYGDNPNLAWKFKHNIKNNDIIIVGSDGLFDNLSPDQIKEIIKSIDNNNKLNHLEQQDINQISEIIAKEAYDLSLNKFYSSPFSQKAKQHNKYFMGGKSDDITVAVGQIKLQK